MTIKEAEPQQAESVSYGAPTPEIQVEMSRMIWRKITELEARKPQIVLEPQSVRFLCECAVVIAFFICVAAVRIWS